MLDYETISRKPYFSIEIMRLIQIHENHEVKADQIKKYPFVCCTNLEFHFEFSYLTNFILNFQMFSLALWIYPTEPDKGLCFCMYAYKYESISSAQLVA